MAEVINMPRLSDTMEEGTVANWLKKVGDKIEEGDILAEIETDKATMEFESFYEGTLLYIGVKAGETTKVDELLAIIGDEEEDISDLINKKSSNTKNNEPPKETSKEATDTSKNDLTEKEAVVNNDETVSENEKSSSNITDLPEGVKVVTMPRLSDTMEEGTVASWLKNVGDNVEEGDILAEIETDKATMEFESFQSGTLLHIGLEEGQSAKVDALLAIIGPKETDVSNVVKNFKTQKPDAKATDEASSKENSSENASNVSETPKGESKSNISNNKPTSTSTQTETNGRLLASPLAKKIAKDQGLDITRIKGSGENGRIIKRDIDNFKHTAHATGSTAKFVASGQESFEEVTNSQMRKVIAKRLGESKFTAPHYYLNVEFNMDNAIAFREQYNTIPDIKISYNDMIVKACALALKQHPQVNSQWFSDKMKLNNHVHIGVAVAVPDGLVVPVLRFTNEQSLPQINAAVKDYAVKAKNKKLTPQEMEGSTFTVSNLGMFGIESFTSIINQPNSAILSVGTIVEKPIVKNGQIVVGNTIKLTLACDHRTVDGATGAQFLQTLKGFIENPITMLL